MDNEMSKSEQTRQLAAEIESIRAALAATIATADELGTGAGVRGLIADAMSTLEHAQRRALTWADDIEGE